MLLGHAGLSYSGTVGDDDDPMCANASRPGLIGRCPVSVAPARL